jgi:hypothetical protein
MNRFVTYMDINELENRLESLFNKNTLFSSYIDILAQMDNKIILIIFDHIGTNGFQAIPTFGVNGQLGLFNKKPIFLGYLTTLVQIDFKSY